MAFFTTRERAELGKSAEIRTQGKVRELVRRDFAPPRRRSVDPELTSHVGTLMQRVAESSLQEIDDLIIELKRQREKLLNESARVQREIIEYAKLSQSTMQSTKIITESLAHWNKVPDIARMSELQVEDIANEEPRSNDEQRSDEERRDSGAEAVAQHSEDDGTFGDRADVAEVPSSEASEATFKGPA